MVTYQLHFDASKITVQALNEENLLNLLRERSKHFYKDENGNFIFRWSSDHEEIVDIEIINKDEPQILHFEQH